MIEVQDLMNSYRIIVSELCDIIKDNVINLSDEFEDDFVYPNGFESYTIKNVYVNKYCNIDLKDNRFLQFDVNISTIAADSIEEQFESSVTFDDIPLTYGLNLLRFVYDRVKSQENSDLSKSIK